MTMNVKDLKKSNSESKPGKIVNIKDVKNIEAMEPGAVVGDKLSGPETAALGSAQSLTFGTSPFVLGAPAGMIGEGIAEYESQRSKDKSVLDALKAAIAKAPSGAGPGIEQMRSDIKQAKEQPEGYYTSGAIGGALPVAYATGGLGFLPSLGLAMGQGVLEPIAEGRSNEIPQEVGINTALTALPFGLGRLAGSTGKVLKEFGEEYGKHATPLIKEAKEAIEQAAKRFGITPSKGMLSDDKVIQGIESSLEQSPTVYGMTMRKKLKAIKDALGIAIEGMTSGKSGQDAYQAGTAVKKSLQETTEGALKPAAEQFGAIVDEASKVALNKQSVARSSKLMEGLKKNLMPKYHSLIDGTIHMMENAKSVADLQNIQKSLNRMFKGAGDDPEAQFVIGNIIKRLRSLENRVIIESGKEVAGKKGEKLAKGLITDLRGARAGYRKAAQTATEAAETFGAKAAKTVPQTIENIKEIVPESLLKKAFNLHDVDSLNIIAKKYPKEFEVLKGAKLQEFFDKSLDANGKFVQSKFMAEMSKIPESARKFLFNEEQLSKFGDVQTLLKNRPAMIGPSGTPQGMAFKEMFSPALNLQDFLKMRYYNQGGIKPFESKTMKLVGGLMEKSPELANYLSKGLINVK